MTDDPARMTVGEVAVEIDRLNRKKRITDRDEIRLEALRDRSVILSWGAEIEVVDNNEEKK